MIHILGVLLTIIAATGLVIIWEWLVTAHSWARARFRARTAKPSRERRERTDEPTDNWEAFDDETRRLYTYYDDHNEDEDLFV